MPSAFHSSALAQIAQGGASSGAPSAAGYTATFGNRPASGALSYSGLSNTTISNLYFDGIGNDVASIRLANCSNVIIEQCDFQDCCEPMVLTNCTNITVRYNRAQNITGPHTRNGSNRGNLIQVVSCGAGIYIGYNIAIGGDTEDIISIYQSNGTSANPIVVEYNKLRNYGYTSSSGSGMMLGDGSGSYIIARYNTLDTPGQCGIGVPGGNHITITENIVYGAQHTSANVGMYVANYSSDSNMNNIVFTNNQVNWKNASGTNNPFYSDGSAGTIDTSSDNFNATIAEPSFTIEG